MYHFFYPSKENNTVAVTKASVEKTPYTWDLKLGIGEPGAIEYFYSLVEQKHKNSNAVIVDVGAQTGLYTLYAKYLPNCKFYAFEPFEDSYYELVKNIEINNLTNVKAYNYALGEVNEKKTLHVPSHTGLNTFGANPKRFDSWKDVDVHVKKLDDILENIPRLDYIKIDTEGWEYYVLKGAEKLILKWKPDIFCEVFRDNLEQCSLTTSQLYGYMASLGYEQKKFVNGDMAHFVPIAP
jgi:FkbM family methyltransferase